MTLLRQGNKPWVPRGVVLVCGLVLALLAGCEDVSHKNIEKWRNTQKGPELLQKAVNSQGDPDMRAHAAQVLVALGSGTDVTAAVAAMPAVDKDAVVPKLVGRLWEDAKVADPLQAPGTVQVRAKDALFSLRDHATEGERGRIDGYLLDWLTGNFARRSGLGHFDGETIVRAIGQRSAPKLVAAAREVLGRPPVGNRYEPVGDEILKGLAVCGDPACVDFLLKLGESPSENDPTLQERAILALDYAYHASTAKPPVGPEPLKPHVARLGAMAGGGDSMPARNVNLAFELLKAAGMPECLPPLKQLASSREQGRRLAAVRAGLECAKGAGLGPLIEAMPVEFGYSEGVLWKYLWNLALAAGPEIAGPARGLLTSKSWIARISAVEILGKVGTKADATEVAKLSGDRTPLKGWWGDPKADPAVAKKGPVPTIGDRAANVAKALADRP